MARTVREFHINNNNNNKNECHSNIIVDKLQGCSHSKKLRESESESRSSKVVWRVVWRVVTLLIVCVFVEQT